MSGDTKHVNDWMMESARRSALTDPVPDNPGQLRELLAEVWGPIAPGAPIACRTAMDTWVPKIARSVPHMNTEHAIRGNAYMVVEVDLPGFEHPVNWPLRDVLRLPLDNDTEARP